MSTRTFASGAATHGGGLVEYEIEAEDGMVVLDAVLEIQRHQAKDLAVRWNCKAAKCGSCSAEINGRPRLMCKTRLDELPEDEPITVEPLHAFPVIRDLVTDVSWNYEVNKRIPPFTPEPDAEWLIGQEDVDRMAEFRKCIECFLCQDVCHVLRDHDAQTQYFGPRFMVRVASLEMHPLDAPTAAAARGRGGHRALQHHEVLRRGLPRAHQDHRQRDHPAQGARRRPPLRPGPEARAPVACAQARSICRCASDRLTLPMAAKHDVLVVGAGLAGMRAAIEAFDLGADVAIVSKVHPVRSHSGAAEGGINAALGNASEDSPEEHAYDTVKGSDYLGDQDAIEILCSEAPGDVYQLENWGAVFSRTEDGRIAQRPFGAAGEPRTAYAADITGHVLVKVLYEQVMKRDIKVYEEWFAWKLVVDDGRCRASSAGTSCTAG